MPPAPPMAGVGPAGYAPQPPAFQNPPFQSPPQATPPYMPQQMPMGAPPAVPPYNPGVPGEMPPDVDAILRGAADNLSGEMFPDDQTPDDSGQR